MFKIGDGIETDSTVFIDGNPADPPSIYTGPQFTCKHHLYPNAVWVVGGIGMLPTIAGPL